MVEVTVHTWPSGCTTHVWCGWIGEQWAIGQLTLLVVTADAAGRFVDAALWAVDLLLQAVCCLAQVPG